ncbi:MAG: hypothetical protein QOH91_2663 [Mycobacterium sp.]|nr:hypothetical protein [Mycobacterium sp.]
MRPCGIACCIPILLVGANLGHRPIDRQLGKVGSPETDQLSIEVGEIAELQQRIVGEVDPRYHVGRVKRHLFCLGEEVIRVALQHHSAHGPHRNLFFGNDFGRLQQIEVEAELVGFGHQLHPELPFRIVARLVPPTGRAG